MSKSYGNYVALTAEPNDMFGKLMSIKDEEMSTYFEIFTDEDLNEINTLIKNNPRDAKVKLATHIVTWLHDANSAKAALEDFQTKFVKKQNPNHMPIFNVGDYEIGILDLMTKVCKFTESNGEARRIIKGGGVTFDGEKVTDPTSTIYIDDDPKVLKVGKRKFGLIVT